MDEDLQVITKRANLSEKAELYKWLMSVQELDEECQKINRRQDKRIADMIESSICKRPNLGPCVAPPTPTHNPSLPSNTTWPMLTPNTSGPHPTNCGRFPPPLTENERQLLCEYEGCTRCRTFYTGHMFTLCNNVPPTRQDYIEHTLHDALRAKARNLSPNSHATPIAVIIEAAGTPPPTAEMVAAILPNHPTRPDSPLDLSDEPSLSLVSHPPTFKRDHLFWNCTLNSEPDHRPLRVCALLDSRAHMTFIRLDVVTHQNLRTIPLPHTETIKLVADPKSKASCDTQITMSLTHYVLIAPCSVYGAFASLTIPAVITPTLSVPLILGMTFLYANKVVSDYNSRTCTAHACKPPYTLELYEKHMPRHEADSIFAAITECSRGSPHDADLKEKEANMRALFAKMFEPLPHSDDLPHEPVARILLKDPNHSIQMRNYPCPCKWHEAWHTLLQQHLKTGHIRPSCVPAGSAAFIIPKADPTVLPHWVNDY